MAFSAFQSAKNVVARSPREAQLKNFVAAARKMHGLGKASEGKGVGLRSTTASPHLGADVRPLGPVGDNGDECTESAVHLSAVALSHTPVGVTGSADSRGQGQEGRTHLDGEPHGLRMHTPLGPAGSAELSSGSKRKASVLDAYAAWDKMLGPVLAALRIVADTKFDET